MASSLGSSKTATPPARWLPLLVFAAVALRLAAAVAIGDRFHFADEAIYVDAAHRLLRGSGFEASYSEAPGYPVLLAMIAAALPSSVLALRLAQAVLGGLGAALVFSLTARLAGEGPAVAAATIYALDPLLVVSAGLLYPETAAAGLMLALVLAAWRAGRDSFTASVLVGVLVATLALLRPVAVVLVPILAVWIPLSAHTTRPRAAAHIGLVLCTTLLVVTPWTYRNYLVEGRLAPIARAGTHMAPAPRGEVTREGLTLAILRTAWSDPIGLANRTGRQLVQFWELYPTRLTTDDPQHRAALHQSDPRLPTNALVPSGSRNLVSAIASAVEFALALVGLVVLWRSERRAALLLSAVTIGFALGYALFVAKLRYRITILPLVFVLAGVGSWKLWMAVAESLGGKAAVRGDG